MKKLKVLWLANFPFERTKKNKVNSAHGSHPAPWIINLSKHLSHEKDVEFHLISFSTSVPNEIFFKEDKIHFYFLKRFPLFNQPFPFYPIEKKKVLQIIKQIEPDIIHCHGTEDLYSYIALQSKYPVVISMQGIMYEIFQVMKKGLNVKTLRRYIIRYLESRVLHKSKYIIAKTEFVRDFLIANDYHDKEIFNIPNIINKQFFTAVRKPPYMYDLTFVGSLLPEKGILDLIDCLAIVKNEIPQIKLNIVGDKNTYFVQTVLQQYIEDRDVKDNILLSGFKTHNEIVPILEKTRLLVLPSHMDTSPNVISEAMAVGVPVLATKVGGIPYMIKGGDNGTLAVPFSPVDLSQKILYLFKNELVREEMAIKAKELILKKQNADSVTKETLSCYNTIIAKTKNLS